MARTASNHTDSYQNFTKIFRNLGKLILYYKWLKILKVTVKILKMGHFVLISKFIGRRHWITTMSLSLASRGTSRVENSPHSMVKCSNRSWNRVQGHGIYPRHLVGCPLDTSYLSQKCSPCQIPSSHVRTSIASYECLPHMLHCTGSILIPPICTGTIPYCIPVLTWASLRNHILFCLLLLPQFLQEIFSNKPRLFLVDHAHNQHCRSPSQ